MLPDGGKDMLNVVKGKSRAIEKAERKENSLYLYSEAGIHRIEPKNDAVIRVTYTQREEFSNTEKPGVLLRTCLLYTSLALNLLRVLSLIGCSSKLVV